MFLPLNDKHDGQIDWLLFEHFKYKSQLPEFLETLKFYILIDGSFNEIVPWPTSCTEQLHSYLSHSRIMGQFSVIPWQKARLVAIFIAVCSS